MAKKYCPLETALNLFNNKADKIVDFTMNCRSLYFRLMECFKQDFTFARFTNAIAEIVRVNENLRTAHGNWEEDNFNISPNHIQFLGTNADYTVFHFGKIKDQRYYIEFSVADEGNAHYIVDREYDNAAQDGFVLTYTLDMLYNQLKQKLDEYVESKAKESIDTYISENENIEEEEPIAPVECACEGECGDECSHEENCSCKTKPKKTSKKNPEV